MLERGRLAFVNGNVSPLFRSEHEYATLLLRAGEILATALDWHQTVSAVCDAVVETVADLCFLYVLNDAGELQLAAVSTGQSGARGALKAAERHLQGPMRRTPVVHEVLETGKTVCISHIDEETLRSLAVSAAHERFMRHLNYRSMVVAPLITKVRGIIGVLGLVRTDRTKERYDERSVRFIEDLARRCATAISKAILFEQVHRIANVFQTAALPARLPVVDGIAFDAFYEPSSEELLVGGDWYDAFTLPDGRIAITIGDVLGHGLNAAVWMSRLRNGFRAAMFSDPDPTRALDSVDQMLRFDTDEEGFFSTALVALVDPPRQSMMCASAGHPGPLFWTGNGEIVDPFSERGLPLGMRDFGPSSPTSQNLSVRVGSFAVFFTDGLLEWNRDISSSWTALEEAVRSQKIRDAEHPAKEIRRSVIVGPSHRDDVALLTVRWDAETRKSGAI